MHYQIKALREPERWRASSIGGGRRVGGGAGAPSRLYRAGGQSEARGMGKAQPFPLLLFSQELLALLEAGLTLVEAIETLAQKQADTETREVLSRTLQALQQGQPLSRRSRFTRRLSRALRREHARRRALRRHRRSAHAPTSRTRTAWT